MTERPFADLGRRAHYARFYDSDPPSQRDLTLVLGNCQAESLRLLLDPDETTAVRVPPVFEMDAAEVRLLYSLLPRVTRLATQPVRDGYRGFPLGSREIIDRLPAGCRVATFPVVRYHGLHPFQVVAHTSRDAAGRVRPMPKPPLTAYHDLRVVATALGHADACPPTRDAVRAVAGRSLAALRQRERRTDVAVSPVLERPGPEHMRTINHPGNPVLLDLADRVAGALSLPSPRDPGRPLLDSVRAPIDSLVAETWGLDASVASSTWCVDGDQVSSSTMAEHHLAWYADHPDVAPAVWQRHQETARLLGLG